MTDVYLNLDAVNPRTSSDKVDAKIVYSSTDVLLENPSEYRGSILRLSIPIQEIPIFLFDGDEKNSNYIVSVTYAGLAHQQPLLFTSEWVGSGPTGSPVTNPFYYGVYFIEHMIAMLNFAIRTCWTVVGSPYGSPPWFGFNPSAELFTLYYPEGYITGGGFRMYFNNNLRILFSGFYCLFKGYSNVDSSEFLFFRQYSDNTPNYLPAGTIQPDGVASAGRIWYQVEDYPTLSSWYQFDRIIVTCNDLPVLQEFSSPINLNQSSASSDAKLPILTDFIINLNDTNKDLRGILEYAPTAEFRYFDLDSDRPIKNLTLEFYASLKTSLNNTTNLYKIPISPGEVIHAKILFRKRSECDCTK